MLNILIVDDSLILRRNLRKMLESLGHKVVGEAKDGREAVTWYRRVNPDLVTMDVAMPEMNGIEAVEAILGEFPDAKVVMATSHGQEAMVRDAVRAGAVGYLLKPIVIHKLRETLCKLFPEQGAPDEDLSPLGKDDMIPLEDDAL